MISSIFSKKKLVPVVMCNENNLITRTELLDKKDFITVASRELLTRLCQSLAIPISSYQTRKNTQMTISVFDLCQTRFHCKTGTCPTGR